ncbi:MAG: alpha-amylase [Sphingobacteriales bacterium]|nr:alpha-amylase [Sphingobacteriales bacterium]
MKKTFLFRLVLSCLVVLLPASKSIHAQQNAVSKWPKGISYEIFVQSFCDSDGDGKGDIKGMTSKLDYLKDLGVEAVWLMPVNPSPSYHKYDVTDYYGIHPDYGTTDDFKQFVAEAHKRNIKVVIDMVLNHCSSKHPWFIDAAKNENSPYREYFVWTHKDDPQIKAFVTSTNEDSRNRNRWNKVEGSDYLYYSYFGPHMPDLNFDSPKLREEIFKAGRYWLTEMGIDGFRLDAARHIFPEERAKESHAWWVYFLNEMQKVKKEVYLVGEVWASSDIVAPYLKGIPALFNFDLASSIRKAVNEERADSLAIKLKAIEDFYTTINPDFIDATFLTNHDQNRIMSSVDDNMDKARIAAALLFTLPGSPYLYYGEEIGMRGKKPDEFIREPFLWDDAKNDKGRATWVKPRYSSDSTIIPAARQLKDKNSLLNYYKTLIGLRNSSKALSLGELSPIDLGIREICSFRRVREDEEVLVLHNLSKNERSLQLPGELTGYNKVVFGTKSNTVKNNTVLLAPCSTLILKK